MHKQVAVFFQQRGQFVAAQTTAIEHGNRVAPLIGQMLDDDEREQRQTLRGLVDLRCGGVGHEVIKTAGITHQLKAQRLEQGTVLILEVRQLRVQLRVASADVVALEQFTKNRCQLGQFRQIKMHGEGSQ